MEINLTYRGASVEFGKQLHYNRAIQDRVDALAGLDVSFTKDGSAVKLTLSKEYIEFESSVNELLEKDLNVQRANPDDIFSYRPKDQWMVFSQFLYDEGFFDSISKEEMNQTEALLQKITAGLDSVVQHGIDFSGDTVKTQLDSYETQLELASSISALSFFSEKFLSGEIKKGFDSLIIDYANHNTKNLENYKSIEETFFKARSKLSPLNVSLSPQAAKDLAITNKLGKTDYSKAEAAAITQEYTEMFETMKERRDTSILREVRENLLEYVLKGIPKNDLEYAAAKKFVNSRVEDTFNRLGSYWEALL